MPVVRTMPAWSWILAVIGLVAAVIAVQFDDPRLELVGAAGFVLLFGWLVVVMRAGSRRVP